MTQSPPASSNPCQPIVVLGLGIAPPASLSRAYDPVIKAAEILVGGRRQLAAFPDAPGERLYISADLESLCRRLETEQQRGRRIVVLADGDPLLYGIGATLLRRLGRGALSFLPGISALQAACARLGFPWQDLRCLSLHGRDDFRPLHHAVLSGLPFCVLTDSRITPADIARHLLDRGSSAYRLSCFEQMETPDESCRNLTLEEAAKAVFSPVCTTLFCPDSPPDERLHLGLDEHLLRSQGSLMTKPAVRAAALSLLRIAPGHCVWDIGAGSGAVALEAAALARQGSVYAVERLPRRLAHIRENRRRVGAVQVEIIAGEAPACLTALPQPQRIFVGGGLSGAAGKTLLTALMQRLAPGGRLVVSAVLLDTLHQTVQHLQQAGWNPTVNAVHSAVSRPLGKGLHLYAHNPVFLISAAMPEA